MMVAQTTPSKPKTLKELIAEEKAQKEKEKAEREAQKNSDVRSQNSDKKNTWGPLDRYR